jgi:hypothetical protein
MSLPAIFPPDRPCPPEGLLTDDGWIIFESFLWPQLGLGKMWMAWPVADYARRPSMPSPQNLLALEPRPRRTRGQGNRPRRAATKLNP